MFRNRWGAMFFVALTLAGVTKLVGTEDERGTIQQTAASLAEQRKSAEGFPDDAASSADPAPIVTLPSDEDLIDPATGFDPSPIDPTPPEEPVVPQDQVVILPNDASDTGQQRDVAPEQ